MTDRVLRVDSHMHLDIVQHCHPERIQWLKDNHCAVISWAFSPHDGHAAILERYLKFQAKTIQSINAGGLPCRFLAGIHPRNIPADLHPSQCANFLKPFLAHPLCLGIGEIGLETGDAKETEFFLAQLELARAAGSDIRIGVHTPRKNKVEITTRMLGLLRDFQELKGQLVVDHCTPETIGEVIHQGWRAGVTLSPVKSSHTDLQRIVKSHLGAVPRILCNTDSGADFHEELVSTSALYAPAIREALFKENALDFFNWRPAYS